MELNQPRIRSPGKPPGRLKEAKRSLKGSGLTGIFASKPYGLARSMSVSKSANTDSCKIFKTQQNGTQPTQNQEFWEASWEAK